MEDPLNPRGQLAIAHAQRWSNTCSGSFHYPAHKGTPSTKTFCQVSQFGVRSYVTRPIILPSPLLSDMQNEAGDIVDSYIPRKW